MKMKKRAVLLRNVAQLATDELALLAQLTGTEEALGEAHGDKPSVDLVKNALHELNYSALRVLLHNPLVRDYVYDRIKVHTGHDVILHLDEGVEHPDEQAYILDKISQLDATSPVNLLYLGGGHGGYAGLSTEKFLSGLTPDTVEQLTAALNAKRVTFDGILLHSCNSAFFVNLFRPLLTEQGIILSYSAELGASSNWEMTINWMQEAAHAEPFFSAEALSAPWGLGELTSTTAVLSTKYLNLLLDLNDNDFGLPDYVDNSDESEFQRELVLERFLDGPRTVATTMEHHIATFNDSTVMDEFNNSFTAALQDRILEEQASALKNTPGSHRLGFFHEATKSTENGQKHCDQNSRSNHQKS
jgi:hypothetical protein